MRIARVFPRRTKATPTDDLAFIGGPDLFHPEVDEVRVSVAFTWDIAEAHRLADAWEHVAPVKIGGPATGGRGDAFEPGMYLQEGYTITSRGCPNSCWFCDVPKREGATREIPIRDGWNLLDDNLLATSKAHFEAVCAMLLRQKRRVEFTGGLEAARLTAWHVERLANLRVKQLFLAFDTPDDWEPLVRATRWLSEVFPPASHKLRCYCLIGYPGDTQDAAAERLARTISIGLMPMAMLFRDATGARDPIWTHFQKTWARPHWVARKMRG